MKCMKAATISHKIFPFTFHSLCKLEEHELVNMKLITASEKQHLKQTYIGYSYKKAYIYMLSIRRRFIKANIYRLLI